MFTKAIRIVYSISYFSLLALMLEVVNVATNWNDMSIYWTPKFLDGVQAFCVIHYPLLIFLLMLLSCNIICKRARTALARTNLNVQKANNIGIENFLNFGQVVPLLTFSDKLFVVGYSRTIFVMAVFLLLFFFTSYGTFNMTLYIQQYHQYRVSTNSSEYWLISKRKIRDFSQSFTVVEISNKILLRI